MDVSAHIFSLTQSGNLLAVLAHLWKTALCKFICKALKEIGLYQSCKMLYS
jgi:hypothetical protein